MFLPPVQPPHLSLPLSPHSPTPLSPVLLATAIKQTIKNNCGFNKKYIYIRFKIIHID
jgi:hypothetical protein